MVDKNYCMSSYLAFRYILDDNIQFANNLKHQTYRQVPFESRVAVKTTEDIDRIISSQIDLLKEKKLGILLSGGMDSAILASYLSGSDAYTFRFLKGEYQKEELKRAEYYADKYKLHLNYVDIDWSIVENNLDILMEHKNAPVHSIEPQIYAAAKQAKKDGIELMIIGNGSDYIFGGMDKLLAKEWKYSEFIERFVYVKPEEVLNNSADVYDVFDKYRIANNGIDYQAVISEISIDESYSSYQNAFVTAGLEFTDPYAIMKIAEPLNLQRIRNGESKYLIRELFKQKYPSISVPEKIPMPRPVDEYFKDWKGPQRFEFRKDLDINKFTGNQKWQIWCLERFLNLIDA